MKQLALLTLAACALLLVGAPAAAGGSTVCESTPEEPLTGVVNGNLVVRTGTSCFLTDVHVNGNAVAEPGSELQLGPGAEIHGNVHAGSGALTASFESTVDGNYKCDDCVFEDVVFSTVRGNVDIKGTADGDFIVGSVIGGSLSISGASAGNFAFAILENWIAGNVKFDRNTGAMGIADNDIGGNLQISGNTIAPSLCAPDACPPFANGHVDGNTVGGNLQVTRNTGEPMSISDNVVGGNLQCKDNAPSPAGGGNAAAKKDGQCRNL